MRSKVMEKVESGQQGGAAGTYGYMSYDSDGVTMFRSTAAVARRPLFIAARCLDFF
jgi:hypothetical protein